MRRFAERATDTVLRLLPDPGPRRQRRLVGRHALVDGVPFELPINSVDTPALMAGFPVDASAAAAMLPDEVHPLRLPGGKGLLVISVINYSTTDIGPYVEFSVALACTHGTRPAPPMLPGVLPWLYGAGQFVLDLPVSTEISVKGGKGIWGLPKHRAPLDFLVDESTVSSQYDHGGQLAVRIDVDRPRFGPVPVRMGGTNYCTFRGMLWRSTVYFAGRAYVAVAPFASARLRIGDAPRVKPLLGLGIGQRPVFTAYLPSSRGVLDDSVEGWFVTSERPIDERPEGMESVVDLGISQQWPDPPVRDRSVRPATRSSGLGSVDG